MDVQEALLKFDLLKKSRIMTHKSKKIKLPTWKLINIKVCFEIYKKRLLDQEDDVVRAEHQEEYIQLRGDLLQLCQKAKEPDVSAAVIRRIQSDMDKLKVKLEALGDTHLSGPGQLFDWFDTWYKLRAALRKKLIDEEMAANGAAGAPAESGGAAHISSWAEIAPQFGAHAKFSDAVAIGAAHLFSCAESAPQFGAPAKSSDAAAIGASHLFSCAEIAPQFVHLPNLVMQLLLVHLIYSPALRVHYSLVHLPNLVMQLLLVQLIYSPALRVHHSLVHLSNLVLLVELLLSLLLIFMQTLAVVSVMQLLLVQMGDDISLPVLY